jgi:hypothetical protein
VEVIEEDSEVELELQMVGFIDRVAEVVELAQTLAHKE